MRAPRLRRSPASLPLDTAMIAGSRTEPGTAAGGGALRVLSAAPPGEAPAGRRGVTRWDRRRPSTPSGGGQPWITARPEAACPLGGRAGTPVPDHREHVSSYATMTLGQRD